MSFDQASKSPLIRPLESLKDYRAAVELQKDTWGADFGERVPTTILKVSRILGGVASGAFSPEGRLLAFVFGMTGPRRGELVHWSDMLAVRPEARDAGLGKQLKLHQREAVMALGVRTMYWTFDPLQARNAYLNLVGLGAVADAYEVDLYGESDSPLHRGIGTDRFVVTWRLDSRRVKRRIRGRSQSGVPLGIVPALAAVVGNDGLPRPVLPPKAAEWTSDPGRMPESLAGAPLSIAIPSDIGSVMKLSSELALVWRERSRAVIRTCLAQGYQATDFVRGDPIGQYVLTEGP